jgi:hypothetical protein
VAAQTNGDKMGGNAKNVGGQNRESSGSKPKLTDAERHKRFVAMALEVEASDDPKDFDEAFKKVILRPKPDSNPSRD